MSKSKKRVREYAKDIYCSMIQGLEIDRSSMYYEQKLGELAWTAVKAAIALEEKIEKHVETLTKTNEQ